jgi:phosphoribosylformimino-5-aminoimidazole carboxamide ribotide isomerase
MSISKFTIFPAIHIRNGEVVRFTKGDIDHPIVFHTDPVACAQQWIDQGAVWLQVINLDAAFDEDATNNWALIKKMADLDVNIQFGGGIRSMDDVHWAMKIGIKRVIIGTAAIEEPQLMADAIVAYGSDAIILGIDADEAGEVKIHGWKAGGSIQATSLAIQMRHFGVTTAILTSIHLDGSMTGVDLDASIALSQISGLNIIVGGGIGSLADVSDCYNNAGITGVIVGKALYTGNLELKKALRASSKRDSFESHLNQWKEEQNTTWAKFSYELVENNLKKHIPVDSPPLRILDAGGGNGVDSLALARMNHQIDLVDTSQQMLDDANVTAALSGASGRIQTHALDILSLSKKFPEPEFDIVLCHNVIQFVDDLEPVLDMVLKMLRPGGFLSLITANQYSSAYQAAFLEGDLDKAYDSLDQTIQYSDTFKMEMQEFRANELSNMLINKGCEIENHYGIRCMYNYWGTNEEKNDLEVNEKLRKLEFELSNREPYKHTARLFQLIARKQ